jgi:pimeloyl-ACP methyl ester carboxylesterase
VFSAHHPPSQAVAPSRALPPAPPLEGRWFETFTCEAPGVGRLEALVAAAPEYRTAAGDAPALVCLPGLAMHASSFLRQLPLGAVAELHFPNVPGYAVPGEEGLGHFARYVEAYIQARELERRPGGVVLLGVSMGGAVAQVVAARGRVKLRGLVLICTFGSARHVHAFQRLLAVFRWVIPGFLFKVCARPVLMTHRGLGDFARDEAHYMADCIHIPSQGYLGRAAYALTHLQILDDARRLAVPTLVMHGTDDHVLPHAAGQELAETIPGAKLVTLEGASHALFFLNHEAVNAAVAEFLRELPAKDSP